MAAEAAKLFRCHGCCGGPTAEEEEEAKYFSLSGGPVVRRPLLISPSHRHLRLSLFSHHFCVEVARFPPGDFEAFSHHTCSLLPVQA